LKYLIIILAFLSFNCRNRNKNSRTTYNYSQAKLKDTSFFGKLSDSAISLTFQKVIYDPTYFVIPYPNGDVPADRGVCCDVIIRAYRKMGIDLQKEVHEDLLANFSQYPHKWNLTSADKNIDHRRVPNLMTFFQRNKSQLPITHESTDYKPGDIVCWSLPKGLTHIGIVIDSTLDNTERNLIVHNIGRGQVVEDCLFNFKIIGHYRFKN
jgi:uncharacterized protein YijF (DUF1287 family)